MARDLIRVTLRQTFLGQVVNNVFWYTVDSLDTDKAKRVAQAFELQVIAAINGIQNVSCVNNWVYAINVDNPADYWTELLTGGGVRGAASNSMLRDDAYGFKYVVNPSVIRAGYKRIAGVDKGYVLNGDLNPGVTAEITTAANALKAQLTLGPLYPALPVIARILDVDPSYLYILADVIDCVFQRMTSQNTRKI